MGKLILKTVKQPLVTEKVDTGLSVRQGNKHLRSGMNIRCLSSKFFFFFLRTKINVLSLSYCLPTGAMRKVGALSVRAEKGLKKLSNSKQGCYRSVIPVYNIFPSHSNLRKCLIAAAHAL